MVTPLLITDNPSQHWVNDISLTAQQKLAYFNEAVLTAETYTEQRIINLLEAECDCAFYAKYEIPSKCHAHKHIALIEGEK